MQDNETNSLIEDVTEQSSVEPEKKTTSSRKKSSKTTDVNGEFSSAKETTKKRKTNKSSQESEVVKSEDEPVVEKTPAKKKSSSKKNSKSLKDDVNPEILDLKGVKNLIHSTYSANKQITPDELDAYIEHLELSDDDYDSLITELRAGNLISDEEFPLDDLSLPEIEEDEEDDDDYAQRRARENDRDYDDDEDDEAESFFDDADVKNVSTTSIYSKVLLKYNILNAEEEVVLAKRMESGKEAQAKLDQAQNGETVLDEQEIANLTEIAEDGQEAKDILIQSNLKLVMKISHYYVRRGLDYEDLVQEGTLGLMKAADKFDYRKGFKFSTYATWWIRQAITRAIADLSRTIRIPVHMVETINRINKARSALLQKLNRDPTLEELSEYLGGDFTPEKIQEVMKYSQTPLSLEKKVGDDENTHIGDFQADTSNISPYDYAENSYKTDIINEALDQLLPREALVIRLRYGLIDGKCHKLDEIGRELNVTRERIRQIESTALNKLKKMDSIKALRDKPDKKF